jgi:hypothetical protein
LQARVRNAAWAPDPPPQRLAYLHSLATPFQVALRHVCVPLRHSAGEADEVAWCMAPLNVAPR